jgi:hypothetical protein
MDALTAELFRDLSQDGLSKLADANTEVVDVVTHFGRFADRNEAWDLLWISVCFSDHVRHFLGGFCENI